MGDFIGGYGLKAAFIAMTAAFIVGLLVIFGARIRIQGGAEAAIARTRQLMHDADKENRNVRPLPLSLAELDAG